MYTISIGYMLSHATNSISQQPSCETLTSLYELISTQVHYLWYRLHVWSVSLLYVYPTENEDSILFPTCLDSNSLPTETANAVVFESEACKAYQIAVYSGPLVWSLLGVKNVCATQVSMFVIIYLIWPADSPGYITQWFLSTVNFCWC